MDPIDVKRIYSESFYLYEKSTKKNGDLLSEIIKNNNININFESRTKSVDSLFEKITRPGKNYNDPIHEITDLCGLRVITYTLSDVVLIEKIIKDNFEIDESRCVDKSKELTPQQFGYLSKHFIVRPNNYRKNLPEWKDISEIWIEIQVRTILQHAWSSIDHILRYKHEEDVPANYRRRLFRISAIFEVADDELDTLITTLTNTKASYDKEIINGDNRIEINIESLKSFIENSQEAKYWIDYTRKNIGHRINDNDWGDLSRDVRFCKYFGINYIDELEKVIKSARGWGEVFIVDYFKEHFRKNNVGPQQVSTVINGINTILLIASFSDKIDADILNNIFGWGAGDYLIKHSREIRKIP